MREGQWWEVNVRVRDHVVLSTINAALLYPWLHRAVLGPLAGGILIDADHYLWFCVRQRRLSPVAAMRFFNQPQPPHHKATRLLHSPLVLLALVSLSMHRRCATCVVWGMIFHVGIDGYHAMRLNNARVRALWRDRFTCQCCGLQSGDVVAHLRSQPWVLPSYRVQHFISLCRRCHDAAHAKEARYISNSVVIPTPGDMDSATVR